MLMARKYLIFHTGNIIESMKVPIPIEHLKELVEIFKKCLLILNIDRADLIHHRIHSTLCLFANVIKHIDLANDDYNVYLEDIARLILDLKIFRFPEGTENICTAAIDLLIFILTKQMNSHSRSQIYTIIGYVSQRNGYEKWFEECRNFSQSLRFYFFNE